MKLCYLITYLYAKFIPITPIKDNAYKHNSKNDLTTARRDNKTDKLYNSRIISENKLYFKNLHHFDEITVNAI